MSPNRALSTAGLMALALASNLASAQTPPPPTQPPSAPPIAQPVPAAPTATPSTKPPKAAKSAKKGNKTRSPESIACSAEADAQNLKGDPRKKFRKTCIAEKKKSAAKN